jgi:hypothetical protein
MQGEKTEHLSKRTLTKAPTPASTPVKPDDGFSVEPSIANHPFDSSGPFCFDRDRARARKILTNTTLTCLKGGPEFNRGNAARNALNSSPKIKGLITKTVNSLSALMF